MKKDIDCQVFQDQLDALTSGTLPEEGMAQLRLHAEVCDECRMLFRIKEHVSLPSLEELEGAVPEEFLASMYHRVEMGLGAPSPRSVQKPWRAWLVPGLAAASAVLLFSTGFLYSELRRVQATGSQLAEEVGTLRTAMASLELRTEEVERTAELAGRSSYQARALDFLITGPESLTLGDLIDLLESFSEDDVLLEASQVRTLRRPLTLLPRGAGELREILKILYREVQDRGAPRDIMAGELAEWLANSGIPRDQALSTSSLVQLLS